MPGPRRDSLAFTLVVSAPVVPGAGFVGVAALEVWARGRELSMLAALLGDAGLRGSVPAKAVGRVVDRAARRGGHCLPGQVVPTR